MLHLQKGMTCKLMWLDITSYENPLLYSYIISPNDQVQNTTFARQRTTTTIKSLLLSMLNAISTPACKSQKALKY